MGMKFFNLLLFALFYGLIYGSQEHGRFKVFCDEISKACHNSLHDKTNIHYDAFQKCMQSFLLNCCCLEGNDDKNFAFNANSQQPLINNAQNQALEIQNEQNP